MNGSPQVGVIYAFAENVVSFGFLFTILSRCIRPNTSVPVPKRSRLLPATATWFSGDPHLSSIPVLQRGADIIGRQTVPAFRKATVKRRISSSITSTLISLGLLCRKKKGKSAINSKNAVDIIEQSNYQFRQWNEASKNVADYNNPDAVKAAIPDGQLCSAGNVGAEWDERSKVWNDKSGFRRCDRLARHRYPKPVKAR